MSGSAWLDRLAHDLRGPLGPIQTAAELLGMDTLGQDKQRELIEMIRRQSRVLAHMIDELADWSSMERGRLLGPREASDLDWLLHTAAAALGKERATRIVLPSSPRPLQLQADARRLLQAFATLFALRLDQQADAPLRIAVEQIGDDSVRIRFGDAIDATDRTLPSFDVAAPGNDSLGLSPVIAAAIITAHEGSVAWEGPIQARSLVCSMPLTQS